MTNFNFDPYMMTRLWFHPPSRDRCGQWWWWLLMRMKSWSLYLVDWKWCSWFII